MTPFFQSLATFFGPTIATIVACLAVAGAAYAYQQLVQRLPQSMREHVDAIAQMAVAAVEQRYSNADYPNSRQKKTDALGIMNAVAGALKIPIDAQHASAAIEAAVYALNQQQQGQSVSAQPTVKTPARTAGVQGTKPLARG